MTPEWHAWAPLLPVAMVGTDRHAAPLPAWPGEVGAAIEALATAGHADRSPSGPHPAATHVLRVAAILGVCGMAGQRPRAGATFARGAAPVDTRPVPDAPDLVATLHWVLDGGPLRLQRVSFARLTQAGLCLPHAMLPMALDLARQSAVLRPALQPLLGERGVWLAQQRDEWHFAAGTAATEDNDPRHWTDGTLEQRQAFLARERAQSPGAARDRLTAALPELPARERAELARGLAVGLGPDDEPLLDVLRADRGQEVRAVAADLLLQLPDSALARRAAARVSALLSGGPGRAAGAWRIEPPTEAGADWKAEHIETVPPKGALGERAWWLYQLVRQVPLAWWTAHTGLNAAELLAWAEAGDWGPSLWRGWRDALRRSSDARWAEAMLDDPHESQRRRASTVSDDSAFLLARVSPTARERYFERQLASADAPLALQLRAIDDACPPGETLSQHLGRQVVARVRHTLEQDAPVVPGVRNPVAEAQDAVGRSLADLCGTLPLPLLADFNDWPAAPNESAAVGRARHEGRRIIEARRVLAAHFP